MVVFRTLPGDAFNCLVIQSDTLEPGYHDQLITLVESNAAQSANEFSEVLARSVFSDGSTMLPSLHVKGLLTKVPTDAVEMVPNMQTTILLSELNQVIAQQAGVSVQDLAIKPNGNQNVEIQELARVKDISPTTGNTDPIGDQDFGRTTSASVNEEPLSDEALAKKFRSDADRLSKEAAELRRQAEELVPTKKKVAVKE
jgi:hypothetical protein